MRCLVISLMDACVCSVLDPFLDSKRSMNSPRIYFIWSLIQNMWKDERSSSLGLHCYAKIGKVCTATCVLLHVIQL